MALPQMDTAWRPDFALGAYVSGQNAANTEASAQEELIKQYLANQQSIAINPLEQRIKSMEATRADAAASPEMIDAYKRGYIGQADTQEVAGSTAKTLAPFKINAERQALENEANRQGMLFTINDIDKQLQAGGGTDAKGLLVPFSPQQKAFMIQKRNELTESLKNTPDYAQKKELSDDRLASAKEIAELRAQYQKELAEAKEKTTKAENESQMIARYTTILSSPNSTPEQKQEAQTAINSIIMRNLMKNPQAWATGLDIPTISGQPAAQTPVQKAQTVVGQPTQQPAAPKSFAELIRQDAQQKPTDVVRTGTRNGKRIEQLRDGTIREVK